MDMVSRGEAERRIRERAISDPAFRSELKENPRAALESELGLPIPSEVSVQVHEESLTELHVVLPATEEELTDAELEMVSGGVCWTECPNDMGP
ncbi:MAG: NHLP leader peptide family natural product precursor [Thermoleophilia bacterium]|nr:NHLP leader peptide family natural product precursor [Thermoleophilia bacterium]MDQ3876455.1 NHLP leader peptide family RiPP precursor [Actinomycetota bacterium]